MRRVRALERSQTVVGRDAPGVAAADLVFNGGTGARPGKDGLSATAYPSGVMGSLVEVTESVTPILIRRRELRPDSGGPGMFRGGLGQIIEVEALPGVPLIIYGTVDRVKHPARGRDGAGCGATGRFEHCAGTAFTGKGALHLEPAERLLVRTPGGGGFGDPLRRAAALVAADVAGGLVSTAAAHSVYGVVFTAQGTVDTEATRRRRLGHTGGA